MPQKDAATTIAVKTSDETVDDARVHLNTSTPGRRHRTASLEYPPRPPLMSPLKIGQSDFTPIYKFVLTGGPCAGKTTAMARLSTFFGERGFRVYLVPEASTLLQTGGASFLDFESDTHIKNFQWQILHMQMTMEDSFSSLARDSGKPCLILCDRGAMDGSAYVDTEMWEEIKAEHELDTVTLRDTRYNAVFHLMTAAMGAEAFYTLENNATRIESVEEARVIDKKTCKAWVGHPKLYVFDNSTGFEGKMQRLVDTAASLCGLPSTVKASRKFRLESPPSVLDMPKHHEIFEVEKVYLQPECGAEDDNTTGTNSCDYSFVRCRSQYGIPAYGMTTVRHLRLADNDDDDDDSRHEISSVDLKRVLTSREYSYAVRHRADPTRHVIKQQRICFLYQDQSFQIHLYKEPAHVAGLAICHIQAASSKSSLVIPPFLKVAEELHDGDVEYSAYKVSMKEDCVPVSMRNQTIKFSESTN